jgi:Holliday junction resolvasome RuvABC endonuclease subunit
MKPKEDHKIALGVDLGTNCGYAVAYFDPTKPIIPEELRYDAGIISLKVGDYDTGPTRFVRLRKFLSAIRPDLVAFEDVKFVGKSEGFSGMTMTQVLARTAKSAELLGAFKAHLAEWCEVHSVPAHGIGIGQIKKRATGKGNAGKPLVIKAANEAFGTEMDPDAPDGEDNIADALWVLQMTLEEYAEGL